MTILLYKDGKLVIDAADPIEGAKLENLAACLANPKDGDTLVYDATAGIWQVGNPLPLKLDELADGDTLAYSESEGAWVNVHAAE